MTSKGTEKYKTNSADGLDVVGANMYVLFKRSNQFPLCMSSTWNQTNYTTRCSKYNSRQSNYATINIIKS